MTDDEMSQRLRSAAGFLRRLHANPAIPSFAHAGLLEKAQELEALARKTDGEGK